MRARARALAAGWGLAAALAVLAWAGPVAAEGPQADPQADQHPAAESHEAAGGEAEHAPTLDTKKLAIQFVNFAILAGLLVFFGGRAINKALLARHQQLKTDLAAAAETRAAAEAQFKKQEARLASLEQEIAAMRAGIKEEAEAEKARLIAAAEERARRIGDETKFMLDQQVKEAQAQLQREAAEASVRVAEELLRAAFDGRDQQRMVDSFVAEVASGDGVPVPAGAPPEAAPTPGRPHPRSPA